MPAYNSSNGNERPYIYDNPGAPRPYISEKDSGRAGLLRRLFGMPKLELTVTKEAEPRVHVEVEATPEEIAVATSVGHRVLGKLKGFLRLRGR